MTDLITYFTNIALTVADALTEHFMIEDFSAIYLICGVFIFCAVLLSLDCVYKAVSYCFTLVGSVFFGGIKRR